MSDPRDLNNLDEKINFRGHIAEIHAILREREKFDEERWQRIEERFDNLDKATELQAREYARRLSDLNGEYKRDQTRQANFVSMEKFEDNLAAEATARTVALERVDEKFADYVLRYEQRQREVDLQLQAQAQWAENAERLAADAAVSAKNAAEAQGRRSNRNLGIASLALALLVAFSNYLPSLIN